MSPFPNEKGDPALPLLQSYTTVLTAIFLCFRVKTLISLYSPVEFTWGSLYPVGDSSLLPLNWLFPQGLWGSQSLNPSAKATAEQSLSLQEGAALGSLVTAQQSVPSDCPLREVRVELALWFQMPHQPGTPSSSLASNSKAPLFLTSWTPNASCPLLPRLRCLPLSHHVPVYCSANVTTTFNTAYVG